MAQPFPVTICDDSRLARRQMRRALARWNLEITEAQHGLEALEAIRAGKGHLVFLDLNMPLLDGYQTLERIRRLDLPCLVIVVSGDVQPDAQARVMALGALGFMAKPIDADQLQQALCGYGLLDELTEAPTPSDPIPSSPLAPHDTALQDSAREVANIAMGRTSALLSQLLNSFIPQPIPTVQMISFAELDMALKASSGEQPITTISQGFIGANIAGEALLMFRDSSLPHLARLLHHQGPIDEASERELLMDMANVLTSAFITNFASLLNLEVCQGMPQIVGRHCATPDLTGSGQGLRQTLAIEIEYQLASLGIHCDLLLLFTEDSLPFLAARLDALR